MAKSGRTIAARLLAPTTTPGNPWPAPSASSTTVTTLGGSPAAAPAVNPFGSTPATGAAALPAGHYVDTAGVLRRADGSRAVSGQRRKSVKETVSDNRVAFIVAGVVVLAVVVWYVKSRRPASIIDRVKAAAAKGAAGVKSAAGL